MYNFVFLPMYRVQKVCLLPVLPLFQKILHANSDSVIIVHATLWEKKLTTLIVLFNVGAAKSGVELSSVPFISPFTYIKNKKEGKMSAMTD